MLFNADAFGHDALEQAAEAIFEVLHLGGGGGALGQMDHAGAVFADHGFGGVVLKRLPDNQHNFAVVVAVFAEEGSVGGKGEIAGHLLPEKMKLVARVPDVVAGRADGVGAGFGVEYAGAGHHGRAHVGLAVEDADGVSVGGGGAVEVRRGRDLLVSCGAGLRPVRNGGGGGSLGAREDGGHGKHAEQIQCAQDASCLHGG